MVVVADASMLSAANLDDLDEAGLGFIVGSRVTKAPVDLESHFRWHGDAFTDGQVIDTLTPKKGKNSGNDPALKAEPAWNRKEHPKSWRAVWAFSAKRLARDNRALTAQENRARDVISGAKSARTPRFVKTSGGARALDEKALARARKLAGLKGYVTNLPAAVMPPAEVISRYHDLWHVEQSFRMSKTDLAARPMFVRKRDRGAPDHRVHRPGRRPRGPGPHRPGHPQRDPPAPPAALGDHRCQWCCPDVPARHHPRTAEDSRRPHLGRGSQALTK
jgi:hypothetical protein